MRLRCCWPLMALLWCGITQVSANENDLPPALAPWRNWVLADVANLGCPSPYDNASERIAVWPSTLELAVTTDGGSWTLELEAFGPSWLPLPGNAEAWPMAVTLDGEPAPVVARDGVPSIQVDPGRHEVTGAFRWSRLPERLAIPKPLASWA